MFYSVDITKLQSIFGSNDDALLKAVLDGKADDLDDNDGFFEGYDLTIDSRTAMRNIFAGNVPSNDTSVAAMYGYVLKILCDHIGDFAGGDIYSTQILPMDSKLMSNGPPIPIPNDPGDFPEIGFLTAEGVVAELDAALNAIPPDAPGFFDNMREYTHHELDEEELTEEIEAYKEVLGELVDQGKGTVAFRH
jgi:hypothetical protein